MNDYRDLRKPASCTVPYGSKAGVHYHIAIQFDQQGAHDLAASHYRAAADTAEPGDLRDFCLKRFHVLSAGARRTQRASAN